MLHHSTDKASGELQKPPRSVSLHENKCGRQKKQVCHIVLSMKGGSFAAGWYHSPLCYYSARKTLPWWGVRTNWKELRKRNAVTLQDILGVSLKCAQTNSAILTTKVRWKYCKTFLEVFYTVPKPFDFTKYHMFKVSATDSTEIKVKRLSMDSDWGTSCL